MQSMPQGEMTLKLGICELKINEQIFDSLQTFIKSYGLQVHQKSTKRCKPSDIVSSSTVVQLRITPSMRSMKWNDKNEKIWWRTKIENNWQRNNKFILCFITFVSTTLKTSKLPRFMKMNCYLLTICSEIVTRCMMIR